MTLGENHEQGNRFVSKRLQPAPFVLPRFAQRQSCRLIYGRRGQRVTSGTRRTISGKVGPGRPNASHAYELSGVPIVSASAFYCPGPGQRAQLILATKTDVTWTSTALRIMQLVPGPP